MSLLYFHWWCEGAAGVLPPASNPSAAVHMSPGKKSRGAAAAPSTTSVPQMFSVPLVPNAVPHPLTATDALSYFPRPTESLEQIQRNQLLQRHMLLAAGQQLTPVICRGFVISTHTHSRCKWCAYGPADATATLSSLALLKSNLV